MSDLKHLKSILNEMANPDKLLCENFKMFWDMHTEGLCPIEDLSLRGYSLIYRLDDKSGLTINDFSKKADSFINVFENECNSKARELGGSFYLSPTRDFSGIPRSFFTEDIMLTDDGAGFVKHFVLYNFVYKPNGNENWAQLFDFIKDKFYQRRIAGSLINSKNIVFTSPLRKERGLSIAVSADAKNLDRFAKVDQINLNHSINVYVCLESDYYPIYCGYPVETK